MPNTQHNRRACYIAPSSLNEQDEWHVNAAIKHHATAGHLSIYYLIDMDDSLILFKPTVKTRQVVLNPALVQYLIKTLIALPNTVATVHYDIVSARSDDQFFKETHLKIASALSLLIHVVNQKLAMHDTERRLPPMRNWGIYCLQDPLNKQPGGGKRIFSCRRQKNPKQPLSWELRSSLQDNGMKDTAICEAMLANLKAEKEKYFFKIYQLKQHDKSNKSQFLARTLFPQRARETPNFLCIMIDDNETQLYAITLLSPRYSNRILGIQVAPPSERPSFATYIKQFGLYQQPRSTRAEAPLPSFSPIMPESDETKEAAEKKPVKSSESCQCSMM
ncbi:MAG: hypothetical protein Q8L78_02035 [Coxiellaceae bacterium]|nr:hypothetical protein [Coxiellaceae bacterium]